MDVENYSKKLRDQDENYEALCKRCGECCGGSTSDPCVNLAKLEDGRYNCKIYDNRHGMQRSVSGNIFVCVNIRDVIKSGASYPNCIYCNNS